MRISPKSGSPVTGHTDVNSGQLIAISYSRSGRGFGNVSSVELDIRENSSIRRRASPGPLPARAQSAPEFKPFRPGAGLTLAGEGTSIRRFLEQNRDIAQ